MDKKYYNLSFTEVIKELKSSIDGLSDKVAQKRLKEFGYNELPREKPFSALLIFLNQFKSTLIYVLLIAVAISFLLQDFINAWVILAAVGLNVIVGFVQEFRAQRSLEKLRKIVTQYVSVKRNGHEIQLETKNLVPGDIVVLQSGDKVPADIRLIQASEMRINEASLTGESFPVKKITEELPSAVILAEQKNMTFMGTTMVAGSGEGVVVTTGQKTQLGKIATLIKKTKEEPTPLQKKLASLGKILGLVILGISFIIFLVGIIFKYDFKEMFTTAVAIAVAAIPEGLVVVVTVILAIGMQRILKQNALVRQLVAAETLGSTTVICTDKTGTLTEGVMRVVRIVTHNHDLDTAKHKVETMADDIPWQSYFLTLKIGVLSSDAYIENPKEAIGHRNIIGVPTEKALVLVASQTGMDLDKLRKENSRLESIPFSSERKFMATLHQDKNRQRTIYCKGAPEVILHQAREVDLDSEIVKLDTKKREKLRREFEKLSSEGLRILALGFKKVAKDYKDMGDDEQVLEGSVFVGFVGIKDPLRQEAKDTIITCQEAGIRPVMLTGDHRLTARAIAQELGLPSKENNIIEGEDFEKFDEKSLKDRIADISVYARVNPHDKLRIIDAWQAKGEVVAMTGDGVNDAPALKSADIGVALGSGTDVAKETADIVLLDNNFKTIVSAIKEGRIIFDNIKRVVLYLLSDSCCEMIIIMGGLIIGGLFIKDFPLPLLASQILWVNLIDDGFPSVALTMERGEQEVMKEKPKGGDIPIIDSQMRILIALISIIAGVGILAIFYFSFMGGQDLDHARTIAFTTLGLTSLFYVFSCRSLRHPVWQKSIFENKYLILAVITGIIFQVGAVYLPPLQKIFQTKPLVFTDWLLVLLVCLVIVAAIEISKWFFIHRRDKKG